MLLSATLAKMYLRWQESHDGHTTRAADWAEHRGGPLAVRYELRGREQGHAHHLEHMTTHAAPAQGADVLHSTVAMPATPGDVRNYDIASPFHGGGVTAASSRWWQPAAANAPLPQPVMSYIRCNDNVERRGCVSRGQTYGWKTGVAPLTTGSSTERHAAARGAPVKTRPATQ